MTLIAWWDTETDGLLDSATKMHSVGIIWSDGRVMSCADQPGFMSIEDGLRALEEADIRVAHNGQDFDERITRRLYPWWTPKGTILDTLLISRLLYPVISQQGPNTMKCPPQLRTRHSLEAWGYRLGERKDDYSHKKKLRIQQEHPDWTPTQVMAEVWGTWDIDMQLYMMQDVVTLKRLFQWLMSRKPSPRAVKLEHDFAAIMRRQERWGFTFDYDAALDLQAELGGKAQALEAELIQDFGDFWMASKEKVPTITRQVKLPDFPDVTMPRYGAKGKPLKPYVGPPKCTYTEGCPYTPVELLQFQPSSPIHVEKMLRQRHNWRPTKFTAKGRVQLDDEVLRNLPYPETPKLADLYGLSKIWGYVSQGRKAWMKTAVEDEPGVWRQHGRVNTVGTYTFRCSHSDPNMGQVPSRDPHYGHMCRALFTARRFFILIGFDGSGMQLRLMAHHMAKYDGGRYAQVFVDGIDPHAFMRDSIGVDLMGEGLEGRAKGKTIDYALPFGGGELRLGSIIKPYAPEAEKKRLGKVVKSRLAPVFGSGFDALKQAIKDQVESHGYIIGLDGRKAYTSKGHTGLSTLLQMGEAIIMRQALVILDNGMQELGYRTGINAAGLYQEGAHYEFCANVHDEGQTDVKEEARADFKRLAGKCVEEAGVAFDLKCPLTSDVKEGLTWADTH
jgi:DNA polymerase-1